MHVSIKPSLSYLFILFAFAISFDLTAQQKTSIQYKYKITVAKDGSGDYTFIQDAIDAMRVYATEPIVVYIKNGIYNEKIEIPATKTGITFIGEDVDKTIITFNDHTGRGKIHTFTSFTAKISGNRFVAENISFVNSAGPVGQAVALYVDADKAVFKNCKFLGHQDTIFAAGDNSRQLFVNCYIEGTTDFIFGPSTTLFDNCTIRSKSNSYITAASTTAGKRFGFVFNKCKLIADSGVNKVYLGRPWRAFAKTVFINCEMGNHIAPEGWHNWSDANNEKSVLYAEYKSVGAGGINAKRLPWSKQLNDKEAAEYTADNIFSIYNSNLADDTTWFSNYLLKK